MRSIAKFIVAGSLTLGAFGISNGAGAVSFTISDAAQEDLGLGLSGSTAYAPFGAGSFTSHPYALTSDPDKGCNKDAFYNFAGGGGPTNVSTCGDTLEVKWAAGTIGATAGMLTNTSIGNGTGLEFHVEDSAGSGTVNGTLVDTLTIPTVNSNGVSISIPFTVNYGYVSDTFQIPAFDLSFCYKNSGGQSGCNSSNGVFYDLISSGTALMGFTGKGDDDWAFQTNLFGCLVTAVNDTTSVKAACQATTPSVISFFAADPPGPADAPEPASLAILGSALVSLRLARRRG